MRKKGICIRISPKQVRLIDEAVKKHWITYADHPELYWLENRPDSDDLRLVVPEGDGTETIIDIPW